MADNVKGITVEIGGDTSKLQQSMSEVDKSIRTTQSSLKDINKLLKFDDGSHSTELLSQKQQALAKIIDDCKAKVEALKQAQEQMKAAGIDENSEQYQELERQIIKAEQQTANYEQQLEQTEAALDGTGDSAEETADSIEEEGKEAEKSSDKNNVFATALTAIGAATAAAIAGLAGLTKEFIDAAGQTAEYGDDIDKMSQKLGISATAYQEWQAIAQHSGTSMESLKTSFKTLANAADDGKDAFERLGMNIDEVKQMSTEDLFAATISALQQMEEGTERTAIASDLLGKGATELGALLNTSAEETENMRQKVHELGGVMSDEAVKDAARYQDSLQDMKTAFTGVKNNLVGEFLPAMSDVMDGVSAIFSGDEGGTQQITDALNEISAKIQEVIPTILEAVLNGIGMIGEMLAASLPTILETVTALIPQCAEIVTSIVSVLLDNLPLLITAGIELLTAVIQGILDNIGMLVDAALQIAQSLLEYLMQHGPELIEGGMKMLEQIASGIINNLPQIIRSATEMFNTFLNYCLSHLPEILQMGMTILAELAKGIIDNLPEIIAAVLEMIVTFSSTVVQNLPEILAKGVEILMKIVEGIINSLPEIVTAVGKIISEIGTTVTNLWSQIVNVGGNIISGIVEGIKNGAINVWNAIRDVCEGAIDKVKSFFGIHSPSTLMRDVIGKNIDLGLAEGISRYSDVVNGALQSVNEGVMTALSNPMNANYSASMNKTANIYLTSPVYLDGKLMTSYVNNQLGVAL